MELARGRRAPFTQVGDWVALSSVSKTAKFLYQILCMHVSQLRSDNFVWPSRAALAQLCEYSKPESIDPYIKELVKIDAIEVRHRRKENGSPDTNLYVVHETPPPGYTGLLTLADFYAQRSPNRGVPPKSGVGVPPDSGGGVPPKSGDELYEEEPYEGEPYEETSPKAESSPAATELAKVSGELTPAVPSHRSDVDQLCEHLAKRIVDNGCKPPKITKAWKDSARLILDKDGRDFDKTMRLIDWCQESEFWRCNIMSMSKFRERYDQLRLQALAEWEREQRPAANRSGLVESHGMMLTPKNAAMFDLIAELKAEEEQKVLNALPAAPHPDWMRELEGAM